MTQSPRSLGTHLHQLEAIERRLHDAARMIKTDHEGLGGLAARIASASEERAVTLARRREQLGLEGVGGPELLSATRGLAALVADAAVSAAALHAVAHRAFDSQAEGNTADLAEAHLGAHLRELEDVDGAGRDSRSLNWRRPSPARGGARRVRAGGRYPACVSPRSAADKS